MFNDSLYTKYRPKKFYDVYGQKYISEILTNQIKNKKFTHAYLFSGTRGTGKTTCARIFAKAINCLNNSDGNPCYECSMCNQKNSNFLNVVELDAASNNSVDQIKNIIEELKYLNFSGGYKIYILDEVHMLSMSAFNALLKTLEEPPEKIIFILSTTEIKKIPQTVISRCQKFEFKNIEIEDISRRLKYITDNEKIIIDEESLELISYMGNGSMRDSISILERVLLYTENVSIENVREILGITSNESILKLLEFVFKKDLNSSLKFIYEIFDMGLDVKNFINNFRNILRDLIFLKIDSKNLDLLVEKNRRNIDTMQELIKNITINELTVLIDKINEINDKGLFSECEYRVNLEIFIVKFLKVSSSKLILDKEDNKEIKSLNKTSEKNSVILTNWTKFLEYLKLKSMVYYSLLQHGNAHEVKGNSVFFKCNSMGILNRLKDINTKKHIEEHLSNFFNMEASFEIFLNDEDINRSIEDKIKDFFGEGVEIENK